MYKLYVYPAYGRTYKTAKQLKADWEAGKDFKTDQGYISKSEIHYVDERGYTVIAAVYSSIRQPTILWKKG